MRDPLQYDYVHYFSTPAMLVFSFSRHCRRITGRMTTYNRALLVDAVYVVSATCLTNNNNTDEYLSR